MLPNRDTRPSRGVGMAGRASCGVDVRTVTLSVGSTFSGVGGMDMGLERSGMRTVWQSEIVPRCVRVLEKRFPNAKQLGDITAADFIERARAMGRIDVLAGGFPCQDLSVAGKRAGLAGKRSGLFFRLADVADALAPEWLLFENVPGLLSSESGRDFAVVLERLTGFLASVPANGWKNGGVCAGPQRAVAWRVLDARHFGVPQRRRRVFLVGHSRSERAFAVLFESESCEGNPAAGLASGKGASSGVGGGVVGTLGARTGRSVGVQDAGGGISKSLRASRRGTDDPDRTTYIPEVSRALTGTMGKHHDDDTDTYVAIVDNE